MMLDGRTGEAYEQHYKNVNTRIGEAQKELQTPMYSSLGTYNIILPVEDIITTLTYRAAIDLLSKYLLDAEQRIDSAGQVQYAVRYDGNPHQDAAEVLRSPRSLVTQIESTNFIQRTPGIVDRNTKDEVYISATAQLEAPELLTWIIPPETDPTIEEIARQVREELELRLTSRVLPSNVEGDDTVAGCDRIIRGVRDFRNEYLGRDVGGRRVGGIYRRVLEQCVDIHRKRYQVLLEEYLQRLLHGSEPTNAAYQAEKRGKLGKAQQLLAHLALYFSDFSAFIGRVEKKRTETDELRSAIESAGLARSDMEANRSNKGLMGVFIPGQQPAIKTQEAYLAAEQYALDIEINDLFFAFLRQTSEALRTLTDQYKAAVDVWTNTLIQGFTGTFSDPGLYRHLYNLAAAHQATREDKQRIVVHEYITDDAYETALYNTRMDGKFHEALAELVWSIEHHDDRVQLGLSGCLGGNAGIRGGRTPTERNAEFFLNLTRRYFMPLRDELKVADRLTEISSERLARKLLERCSPMVRFDTLKIGGLQERHNFVCVDEDRQKSYFNEFRGALRLMGGAAKDNQVLSSSNPYTCTILSTDDVLASVGLNAYITAEAAYNSHTGNARLLHIFPAEVNAVSYEQQLPQIGEVRRRFSHSLTTMLEDVTMVQRFIRCYLYRFIRLVRGSSNTVNKWILDIPTEETRRRTSNQFVLTPEAAQPSLFQAMETFVFRKSDYLNEAWKIDFELIDRELERYEQLIGDGDDNRLINHLETLIDSDVEGMRKKGAEQTVRDLGSLMRLIVDEYVLGLENRLKTSGRVRDTSVQPYLERVQVVDAKTATTPAPVSVSVTAENGGRETSPTGGADAPIPLTEPTTAPTPVSSKKVQLQEIKELLELGEISEEEYDQMRKNILGIG
ncbi:SHOCT domain-containing protein [bacterium]|nr:SHOCT domain-containing protein [bacterium]